MLRQMQAQPILIEKIVANLLISVQQNRHFVAPFCFERGVLIDIDYVNFNPLKKTARQFL